MRAVAAIANVPQNVTRPAARPIGAPPARAPTAPSRARKTSDKAATTHMRALSGEIAAAARGRAAPAMNVAAEARAAWVGLAVVTSEMPSSSRA